MIAVALWGVDSNAQYTLSVSKTNGEVVDIKVDNVDEITWEKIPESTYKCVDLGLSVKWATCNVGASKPESYGGYYAWGEVESKNYYDKANCKLFDNKKDCWIKYCHYSTYKMAQYSDDKKILDPVDDVAHVKWGGDWRMPTKEEWEELMDEKNCSWVWEERNGVFGYTVTSNKVGYTDKSIFLPAAGYRYDGFISESHDGAYYWSSFLESNGYVWCVIVFPPSYGIVVDRERYIGMPVRPVCP